MVADLVKAALAARDNAYAPYSKYQVGAALLTEGGKVYMGANVENSTYGATICAERTAFVKAVSENERKFTAIAVAARPDDYCIPCGICLQVMTEFCNPAEFEIISIKNENDYKTYKLKELLPLGFKFS